MFAVARRGDELRGGAAISQQNGRSNESLRGTKSYARVNGVVSGVARNQRQEHGQAHYQHVVYQCHHTEYGILLWRRAVVTAQSG